MDQITSGKVLHLGTYNGNPLCMAAAKAVLGEVCTPEATDATIDLNRRVLEACQKTITDADLPAHTVQFGAKALRHVGAEADPELPRLQGAPTSTSPSRSGCTASTVACCCRRVSTSSG